MKISPATHQFNRIETDQTRNAKAPAHDAGVPQDARAVSDGARGMIRSPNAGAFFRLALARNPKTSPTLAPAIKERMESSGHGLHTPTALKDAIRCCERTILRDVKRLLQNQDVDLSHRFPELGEKTLLHLALSKQDGIQAERDAYRQGLVRLLLDDSRIDPNRQDADGKTALHYAMSHQPQMAFFDLQADPRVDVNMRDNQGRSPLFYAVTGCTAEFNTTGMIRQLLQHPRISPGVQDNEGNTALHVAMEQGSDLAIQALLSRRDIDICVRGRQGRTPLHYAVRHGREDIVRRLLNMSEKAVNLADDSGQTPLHIAAMHGSEAVARALLTCKTIDVHMEDSEGRTARDVAREYSAQGGARFISIHDAVLRSGHRGSNEKSHAGGGPKPGRAGE